MQYGVCYFPTHYGIEPGELGRAAEQRGFDSLLFPEHTHIPVSRRSPYPGGGDLPRQYVHTYDPFVACTAAAATTTTLRVGTGVCLVIERDPITTAKEVASVDHLSGGRFVFGVGAGWNREEMGNHGTDARVRMRVLRERVLAMQELWSKDEAEFHGRYVDFESSWSWPKPVQSPMPVMIGGMGPGVEDRILEYGHGWMAQHVTEDNASEFAQRVTRLRERASSDVPVDLFGAASTQGALDAYAGAGVGRCLFLLPDDKPNAVLAELDRLAELVH